MLIFEIVTLAIEAIAHRHYQLIYSYEMHIIEVILIRF